MDDETSQTNAPTSQDQNLEANAEEGKGNAPEESNTNDNDNKQNSNNAVIEVTEDSFENDAPPGLDDSDDDDDDDSAVEIVDAATFREQQQRQQQAATVAAATTNNNGNANGDDDSDEELQCVGTANETKLPHNRQDCLTFRYNNNNNNNSISSGSSCCAETTLENAKFCQLCYCYVCDKPASECTYWYLGEKGVVIDEENGNGGAPPEDDKKQSSSKTTEEKEGAGKDDDCHLQHYKNHCNATDKGTTKYLWKNMRTAIKAGRDPSVVTGTNSASAHNHLDDSLAQYLARYTVPPPVAAAAAASTAAATAATAAATFAEQLRQRQRERHRYRAHATGRGGAHHRRTAQRGEEGGNYSSIYASVSMDAANAMDFSSSTSSSSSSSRRRSRAATAAEQPRRTCPSAGRGSNSERPRHSNHRDRMRTQQILEDLYS